MIFPMNGDNSQITVNCEISVTLFISFNIIIIFSIMFIMYNVHKYGFEFLYNFNSLKSVFNTYFIFSSNHNFLFYF